MAAPSASLLRWFRHVERRSAVGCTRALTTSASSRSGHSKWATIKHDKAKNDGIKNKQRTLAAKEISNASKHGGMDPKSNPPLALAIANAKKSGMHKETIEAAVLRGQGKSATGVALESLTLEAMMTPVAMIIDVETDSKLRALQDLRVIIKDGGALEGQTAYMFERRGRIAFAQSDSVTADDILETALDAGALDVEPDEEGNIIVDTEPSSIKAVESALAEDHKLNVLSSEAIWRANDDTLVGGLEEGARLSLQELISNLEEYPGVQAVYTNIKE